MGVKSRCWPPISSPLAARSRTPCVRVEPAGARRRVSSTRTMVCVSVRPMGVIGKPLSESPPSKSAYQGIGLISVVGARSANSTISKPASTRAARTSGVVMTSGSPLPIAISCLMAWCWAFEGSNFSVIVHS
eukprot:Amastigsp_a174973_75.p4 type:complete len:132 gc:universal Amastigsp_a174973_75:1187-1582(+)